MEWMAYIFVAIIWAMNFEPEIRKLVAKLKIKQLF